MKRYAKILPVAAAAGALLASLLSQPALAYSTPSPKTLGTGLSMPLGLSVDRSGKVYVAESSPGIITRLHRGRGRTVATADAGLTTAGVDVSSRGTVAFTASGRTPDGKPIGFLEKSSKPNRSRTLANLARFEARRNPDKSNRYGFRNISRSCAEQVPAEIGGEPYRGIVDSNPFAVKSLRDGSHLVADAAGNSILHVRRDGRIRVVAVLPPSIYVVTADAAGALGLPDCTVGKKYAFESVPTDVEVGPGGRLYVTALPGGPEDASLGARGSVFRVNPYSGHVRRVATGFLGATDVAVSPRGTLYVTELFADRISMVRHGRTSTFADLPQPSAVEYAHGRLYATSGTFVPDGGSVVAYSLRHGHR